MSNLDLGPVFEQHPLPHLVYDVETLHLLAANAAALAYYGHSRDELLALRRPDLLDPQEWEAMQAFLAALPASAEAGPQRAWRERRRDGAELRSDIRGMPLEVGGRAARMVVVTDAWPRLRAEEEARRQRDLVAVAARVARIGGWRVDVASGQATHTEQVRAIHDLGPGEGFDLSTALSFYPLPGRAELEAALLQCVEAAKPFDLVLPFVSARGRELWVRVTGEPVTDAAGRVVELQGSMQDVTERKAAEQALDESRERLDAVVRVLPDLWMVFDENNRYVDVNDPNHPALSSPWADKVGRRLDETVDPALARLMRSAADEARTTGRLRSYLYEMTTQRGERRHFEGRSVPMDGGRWMNLVRDITDTVHLEQRFRLLTELVPIGIFETDAEGHARYVNRAWQALHGLNEGEAAGDGWQRALHPDDRSAAARSWIEAVAAGRDYEFVNRVLRRDGSQRHVAVRCAPMRRADGTLLGYVGTAIDVTEAEELAQARHAREVAEEANRRQAAFLSKLSHELRTPLNAIIGFSELLLMQQPPASMAPALGHVRDAGAHMLDLVNDLLELQRVQQGGTALRPERLAVRELLEACAGLLGPLLRQHDVRVEVDADAALSLETDRRTLQQVVLNLGSNGVKYGRRGGRLSLRAASVGAGTIRLQVADDGEGLSAEQQARLFQPFERLGRERSGVLGTGLGLVITRQLVGALGGALDFRSAPGQGTTVVVTLPAGLTLDEGTVAA